MSIFLKNFQENIQKLDLLNFFSKVAIFLPILLFFLISSSDLSAYDSFKIINVIPSGDNVENVNQIVVKFSRPVVAFGDNNAVNLPIKIDPGVDCKWQWANVDTAICYLNQNEKLKLSTNYKLKVDSNFRTFDGAEFAGEKEFRFSTLHSDVSNFYIKSWVNQGKPIIKLTFNQFVEKDSIEKVLYFTEENDEKNLRSKYGVNLLEEKQLLSEYDVKNLNDEFNYLFKSKKEKNFDTSKKIIFIQPTQDLPSGKKIKLILDNGLKSVHGSELNMGAREILNFKTFDEPEFLGVKCYIHHSGKYEEIKILVKDIANDKKCLPNNVINLLFSSPIKKNDVLKYLKFTPELSQDIINNIYDQFGNSDNSKKDQGYYVNSESEYQVSLYGNFQANQSYNIQSISKKNADLQEKIKNFFNFSFKEKNDDPVDIFGRKLNGKFDFSFSVDHCEPQLFFSNYDEMSVLESSRKNDVLLTARNFKDLFLKYNIISFDESSRNQEITKNIVTKDDIFVKVPLGIRELLNGKTGLIFGELSGYPTDLSYPMSKNTFMTQVTNFGIFGKIGHYNSLIYLIDLISGAPVRDANVKLLKSKFLEFNSDESQIIAVGKTDENGIAMLEGTVEFDKSLKALQSYDNFDSLIVQVEKNDEMGWLPIRYNHVMSFANLQNIHSVPTKKYNHLLSWGFTSQGIYKAGDEVNYKFYVRNNENTGVGKVDNLSYKAQILDKSGKIIYEKNDIKLSEFGSFSDSFKLNQKTESGWYDLVLIPNLKDNEVEKDQYENDFTINVCKFLVSDFKTAPFKVRTELSKKNIFYQDELEISNYGELYSGGYYSNAKIDLDINLEQRIFDPSKNNPSLNDFIFYDYNRQNNSIQKILSKSDKLNESGEFIVKTKVENNEIPYGEIVINSNVADDNGKLISNKSHIKYYGVDKFVGLKASDWFFNKGSTGGVNFAVTDSNGNLVKDVDVNLQIQINNNDVDKVKIFSETYKSQDLIAWENVDSCNKKSDFEIEKCNFIFNKAGNYRAIATIHDGKNRIHSSVINLVVFDNDEKSVENNNSKNLEIIPEKNEYKVGEKARFMVKNPFLGANALITVERYGVLKKFIKKFDKSLEILEFDLNEKDAPGFYLSVALMLPRLKSDNADYDKDLLDSPSDTNKPFSKIDYSKILVTDTNRYLKVNIETNKDVYQPKENVNLKLNLDESSRSDEVEATVLVIDDATLDLLQDGINYFNPGDVFKKLQNLDVMNYSLFNITFNNSRIAMMNGVDQNIMLGQRFINNSDILLRKDFENLAFFKDTIILKKGQKEDINFILPDNLTNWSVVVISNDKESLFEMDTKTFKVNKETEIRSLLPNYVLSGDKFDAAFTIFNRSDKRRVIKFDVTASGAISKSIDSNLYNEEIVLEPYARKIVTFPIAAVASNVNNDADQIKFIAKGYDVTNSDSVEFSVNVLPPYVIENIFDNKILNSDDSSLTRAIKINENAMLNFSSMKVNIGNSILNNIINFFSFIKDYKYNSLDQVLSKLLVSINYIDLNSKSNKNIFGDFIWNDASDIAKQNYETIKDYQMESGGFSYFESKNSHADPYLSATTLDVLTKVSKIDQNLQPLQNIKLKLIEYLKISLSDEDYKNYDKYTVLDTQAFILDVLAKNHEVNIDDFTKLANDFQKMSLFGESKIFNAAITLHSDPIVVQNIFNDIMQYKFAHGGKYFSFDKPNNNSSSINHSTAYTENCSLLSSLLNFEKNFDFYSSSMNLSKKDLNETISKLANGISNHNLISEADKIFNTNEAMICVDALSDYARTYESQDENITDSVDLVVKSKDGYAMISKNIGPFESIEINDLGVFKNYEGEIKMTRSVVSKNNIYYNAELSLYNKLNFENGFNRGIGIKRKYQIKKDEKFIDVDDLTQFKSGDIVKVILKIDIPSDRYFVVVDDYIPGCFEQIDENLKTSIKITDNNSDFYYKDLTKDHVHFYSEYLKNGEYEASYFVQVVSKGRFTVLPATAREMYNQDIIGSTKADVIFTR